MLPRVLLKNQQRPAIRSNDLLLEHHRALVDMNKQQLRWSDRHSRVQQLRHPRKFDVPSPFIEILIVVFRSLTSAIITICIGREQRLFAAHEDVLAHSPYLSMLCQSQFYESTKRIDLPDEEPEVFSSVLEYLYKGDYYPRLEFDKRRQSWQLEDGTNPERQSTIESTVFMNGVGVVVLKDTVIYVCSFSLLHMTHFTNVAP